MIKNLIPTSTQKLLSSHQHEDSFLGANLGVTSAFGMGDFFTNAQDKESPLINNDKTVNRRGHLFLSLFCGYLLSLFCGHLFLSLFCGYLFLSLFLETINEIDR